MKKLFVYGTLRERHPNSGHFGLAGQCKVTNNVALQGYQLFDLGWYPGIKEGPGRVFGDVFEVPDPLFARLDEYEGVGSGLYKRVGVTIGGVSDVQIYVYARDVRNSTPIASGDWFNKEAA